MIALLTILLLIAQLPATPAVEYQVIEYQAAEQPGVEYQVIEYQSVEQPSVVNPPAPEPRAQTPRERYVGQLVDQLPRDQQDKLLALTTDPDANAEAIDLFVQRHLPQLRRPAVSYGPTVRRTYTYRTYTQAKPAVRRIWRRR